MNLEIINNETEYQYIWRLHQYVKTGELTWEQLAEAVNERFREDETLYRTESSYRKPVQSAEKYYEEVFSKMVDTGYSEELSSQKREIERLKVQYRDERNAWQKQNRIAARAEQKLDYLEQALEKQGRICFENNTIPEIDSDNDMLVCLSDLHIGQCFSSVFGEYNSDIAKDRLSQYLEEILKIQKRHNSKNCYVSLQGDIISNSIHKQLSVTNRENVIEQIKLATELIASFCYELTKNFTNVFFMSCAGNHSRIDSKEDALHDERLDDLISWNIEHFLSHIENFHVQKRKLDIGIVDFNIRGKTYIGVHGDYDAFSKTGVTDLVMMLGFIPYALLCGHRHYPAISDFSGVKMIQSGSLAGSGDDYSIEKRLTGKPSQTVCICTTKGIECYYPIELS